MNDKLEKLLTKAIEECKENIKVAKRKLRYMPEGRLRVSMDGKKIRLYQCINDSKGKYIKKSEKHLAMNLANKEYYSLVINEAEKRLSGLNKLKKQISGWSWNDIKNNMHKVKQSMITNDIVSEDQYIREWEEADHYYKQQPCENETRYMTKKGHWVRSKTEAFIADTLYMNNIPYHYEEAFYCSDGTIYYPDFTILDVANKRVVIYEHFGLMQDPDYRMIAAMKINKYVESGLIPFETFYYSIEGGEAVVSTDFINKFIENRFAS